MIILILVSIFQRVFLIIFFINCIVFSSSAIFSFLIYIETIKIVQFEKRRIVAVKLTELIIICFILISLRIYSMFYISHFSSLFFIKRILVQYMYSCKLINIFLFNTQACGSAIIIISKSLNYLLFIRLYIIMFYFLILN